MRSELLIPSLALLERSPDGKRLDVEESIDSSGVSTGLPLSTWNSWLSPTPGTATSTPASVYAPVTPASVCAPVTPTAETEQDSCCQALSSSRAIVDANSSSAVDSVEVDESAVKAAEDALRLNRALQARVQRALEEGLPIAKARNRAQQERVNSFLCRHTLVKSRRQRYNPAASYFSDPKNPRAPPPKNKDAIEREIFQEKNLKPLRNRRWFSADGDKLLDTMKRQLKEEAFIRLYGERTKHSMQVEKQKAFKELCEEIKGADLLSLWQIQGGKTDWIKVSQKLQQKGVKHCPRSCFTHFIHVLDPRLERGRFCKNEDMALVHLATKYGGFKWDKVAKMCGNGCRTPWCSFSRYQQFLNPHLLRSEWTDEEDLHLRRVIDQIGGCRSPGIIFAQIGNGSFGGRTSNQIRDRFFNRLDAKLQKGQYEPAEVRRLSLAVQVYGRGDWQSIGSHMGGRSPNTLICRYENVDAPELKRLPGVTPAHGQYRALPWGQEEDDALLFAIEKYGAGDWSIVRQEVPGRSKDECWRRFNDLNPDGKADQYDVLLATKRKVLPSNVSHMRGRKCTSKRRRSELVASDFQIRLTEFSATTKVPPHSSLVDHSERDELDEEAPASEKRRVEYLKLTTGDSSLDRSLKRINKRRQKHAKIKAQSLAGLRDVEESERHELF